MLNIIHYIFMKNKTIYYIVDEILHGYYKNKKFNSYLNSINIHVVEETFSLVETKKILSNTRFVIKKYFGFYKIIYKDMDLINRNSICINIFLVEKVRDKIILSSNINEIYSKFFNLKKKYFYNFNDVFPIQKVRFENIDICIPINPDKIIKELLKKNLNINNTYCPLTCIYEKFTGIRNIEITQK